MAQQTKILLVENVHPVATDRLKSAGFHVVNENASLSEADLLKVIQNFDVLGIRSKTNLSAEFFNKASHLLTVGAFCIGTNQIDLVKSNKVGIPVFNAPYSNTRSVAEMVIGQMISLARNLGDRNMQAHQGKWNKSANGCFEVRGKILGIIGYGHIGSQLSVLAESLGLHVIYYDVVKKLPLGNSRSSESMSELLKYSDFVTLHVPETPQTKNMISQKELSQMKKGAFLINASRGTVIDIPALVDSLKSGHLGGVALDVFPYEPQSNSEAFESPLKGLSNVILSPHIGGSTEEAQEAIGAEVAESFIKFLKNGSTRGAVNFPNVDLPTHDKAVRLLNVHKNVPGVLKDINEIVAQAGANISAQYLSTDPEIGYLVMDLENAKAQETCEHISKLKTNIKTRIL
jgi:D-3-phosphoglycerate dehydrogenase